LAVQVAVQVAVQAHRRGVFDPDGRVALHWRTLQFPPRIIEYVLAHELVHLLEPNHGPAFWSRLARLMPDYAACKEWLALNGAAG
jgi:predicted metal-dependent hydrolase